MPLTAALHPANTPTAQPKEALPRGRMSSNGSRGSLSDPRLAAAATSATPSGSPGHAFGARKSPKLTCSQISVPCPPRYSVATNVRYLPTYPAQLPWLRASWTPNHRQAQAVKGCGQLQPAPRQHAACQRIKIQRKHAPATQRDNDQTLRSRSLAATSATDHTSSANSDTG